MPRSRTLLAVALTVLLSTAACGGPDPAPDSTTTTVRRSVAESAPPPAERCRRSDDTTATPVVVTASDGAKVSGAEWGEGPRGVVLLHQRGGNLCQYWDYATELATAGFHVVAIDFRNGAFSDYSDTVDYTLDAAAAVAWLKNAGATNVVLVGASIGATTAMVTAGRHPGLASAVVALSLPPAIDVTDGNGPEPTTPEAAAPLIDVPLLMCWAEGDPNAVDPQPFIDAAPAADKQVVTRDGRFHGWELLRDGPYDVRPEVLAFLEQHA